MANNINLEDIHHVLDRLAEKQKDNDERQRINDEKYRKMKEELEREAIERQRIDDEKYRKMKKELEREAIERQKKDDEKFRKMKEDIEREAIERQKKHEEKYEKMKKEEIERQKKEDEKYRKMKEEREKEERERQKKEDEKYRKMKEEREKEERERQKKSEEKYEKMYDRAWRRVDDLDGKSSRAWGYFSESSIKEGCMEALNEVGVRVDHYYTNEKASYMNKENPNKNRIWEFDLIPFSHKAKIAIPTEVKTTLCKGHINEFIKKLRTFLNLIKDKHQHTCFDKAGIQLIQLLKDKKIYAAVGYVNLHKKEKESVIQHAQEHGLLVLSATKNSARVVTPKDFKPNLIDTL